MGNNKWRKILTILMIINLCFILFGKITKVLGVTTYSNILQSEIDIPDWLYEHSFNVSLFNNGGGYYNLIVNYFDDYKVYYDSSRPNTFVFDSTKSFKQFSKVAGKTAILNYLTNLTSDQFRNQNNVYIMENSSSYENFYNFKIYDYTNQDTVYMEPNTTIVNYPYFANVAEIESGKPDGVIIEPRSYGVDDTLYFHLLEVVYTTPNSNNDTIYYYMPKIFALDKSSPYLKYYLDDEDYPYYNIPRSALGLSADSSYLYVLSNSSESYNNSVGVIQEDGANGVFDVITSDTTGVFSTQESIDDNVDNIDDFLRDNTVGDYNLNYNNENSELTSMNNGFFSRLLSLVSDTFDYELSDDTVINIPMPHSNKTIELHSNILYNNVNGVIRTIIEAFWFYIFGFYVFRFINKLYIAISSGSILDTFSSSDEAITNNML